MTETTNVSTDSFGTSEKNSIHFNPNLFLHFDFYFIFRPHAFTRTISVPLGDLGWNQVQFVPRILLSSTHATGRQLPHFFLSLPLVLYFSGLEYG